ncbi:MAG: hypothetical protein WDZ40_00930 [Candidatus Spechtbacterales bacterium]
MSKKLKKQKINKKSKIKVWHLMPLSLLTLVVAAVFIWLGRGDFSTRNVELEIEGPGQVENGKAEDYKLIISNNSDKALQDLNLTLETPSTVEVLEGLEDIRSGIDILPPGSKREVSFKIVVSSTNGKESLNARLDYSPEGLSARFVETTSLELIIGKLDVSIVFDLPQNVYADQDVRGSIIVVPHSDIETSPLFLRLDAPQGFSMQEVSEAFAFETVWRIGELKEGQTVKREFRGRLSSYEGEPLFKVSLGKRDGISFLPLHTAERAIGISESPLVLNQSMVNPARGFVDPGERATVRITYTNKANVPLEDALLRVSLPESLVDFSTIAASGGIVDSEAKTIEWTQAQLSSLRFTDVEETGTVSFSFNVRSNIEPANVQDTNKTINIITTLRSQKESLALNGAVLQAENTLSVKLSTRFELEQSVYRQGGSFDNTGPHPPVPNQLSTYTVRWTVENTTNAVRLGKVEAVLPDYVVWQSNTSPAAEDVRYLSDTNTVVWELGDVGVGVGFVYPERTVEFQIGLVPDAEDIQNQLNVLEQTKLTGIDIFTSSLLDQDIPEEEVPN